MTLRAKRDREPKIVGEREIVEPRAVNLVEREIPKRVHLHDIEESKIERHRLRLAGWRHRNSKESLALKQKGPALADRPFCTGVTTSLS